MEQAATGATARVDDALRRATADPELLAAGHALAADDLPRAESLLRQRLRRAPTDVAAIRMLAEIAARLGRYEDASAGRLWRCRTMA